jgi:hypothetical protein
MYRSEITRFLDDLKTRNPRIEERQREGRAIWWDKPQDLDTLRRHQASRVRQNGYVYQTRD